MRQVSVRMAWLSWDSFAIQTEVVFSWHVESEHLGPREVWLHTVANQTLDLLYLICGQAARVGSS